MIMINVHVALFIVLIIFAIIGALFSICIIAFAIDVCSQRAIRKHQQRYEKYDPDYNPEYIPKVEREKSDE